MIETGPFLDQKRKMVTNATLLGFYLSIASHVVAPPLLEFFGFSLSRFTWSVWSLIHVITPSLTDRDPWILILSLVPHFLMGFDVETNLGSLKYLAMLAVSGSVTNIATILISLIINKLGFDILPKDYVFASSSPLGLLVVLAFNLLLPQPIGTFSNIGRIMMIFVNLLIFVKMFMEGWVMALNYVISWIVNIAIIKFIDSTIPISAFFDTFKLKNVKWAVEGVAEDEQTRVNAIRSLAKTEEETKGFTA